MYVYKQGAISDRYAVASIDSVGYIDGTPWSNHLATAIDVTSFGVVGDGETIVNTALLQAIQAADRL